MDAWEPPKDLGCLEGTTGGSGWMCPTGSLGLDWERGHKGPSGIVYTLPFFLAKDAFRSCYEAAVNKEKVIGQVRGDEASQALCILSSFPKITFTDSIDF